LPLITQDIVLQTLEELSSSKEWLSLGDLVKKVIKKGETKEEIRKIGAQFKKQLKRLELQDKIKVKGAKKDTRYKLVQEIPKKPSMKEKPKKKKSKPVKTSKIKKKKTQKPIQKTLTIEDKIPTKIQPAASVELKPEKGSTKKVKMPEPKIEIESEEKSEPVIEEAPVEVETPKEKPVPIETKKEKPVEKQPKKKARNSRRKTPVKRIVKRKTTKKESVSEKTEKGVIRQGGIAEFMRKRTQLVGFDFGYHKHTQYAVEFIDNSLDAIETAYWKEKAYRIDKGFNFKWNPPQKNEKGEISKVLEDFDFHDISKKTLVRQFHNFIEPVFDVIDKEPILIIRLREIEKVETLDESEDVRLFCFEILDNGIGMIQEDLEKFGLYLASSKSKNLKQTRGSQGFGASSAFSDAQNTSAKPIVVITRHASQPAATISAFYTTEKNEKKYELEPDEFRTRFKHGTYVKLFYQNKRYIRGYADEYIRQTALLNGHVNIVFIDTYGTTTIYPRKVQSFPQEPNYAKPHPSSVSIGDFQELLRNNPHADLVSLFSEHFVRMSKKKAKTIIENANKALGTSVNIFSVSPDKLDDRQLRALYRNITSKVDCFQRNSADVVLKKMEETPEEKLDAHLKKNYKDVSGDYVKKIMNKYGQPKKKVGEISKEEIKTIQEIVRESINCPYSISFKRFKTLAKENGKSFSDFLSKDFCSINTNMIKKIIENADKKLGNKSLNSLPVSELKKKETQIIHAELEKIVPTILFNDFTKTLKENASKTISSILRNKYKEIKSKARNDLLATITKALGFSSVNDKSLSELTGKELRVLYDEMMTLPKCPASISLNNLKEIMSTANTKQIQTAIKRSFSNLSSAEIEAILDKTNDSLGGSNSLEMLDPSSLDEEHVNALYQSFISEKYLAPPTDTVVPVGAENLIRVIEKEFNPAFCDAETRNPTSGKGLAFGVEVAVAYGGDIKPASRATDVIFRFVNRTPKLRDNSDCQIWKAAAEVNWKNYKVDTFENRLPRGKIRVIINVSGPFVHVMFKSQSKQALADDENLKKEIKLAIEQVGRRLRNYITKREKKRRRARRASLLLRNVKEFAASLCTILERSGRYKENGLSQDTIEEKLTEPIKREVEKDILSILSTHWENRSEIMEDLGLSENTSKVAKHMIDEILNNLVERGWVLMEKREVEGIKIPVWRLAKEVEDEEEEFEEPEIITIPGEAETQEEMLDEEEEIIIQEDTDSDLDMNGGE